MTELFQSVVFQTIISGVLIFIIGEVIQNFWIKPYIEYKGVIGRIDNKLKFYANFITNPMFKTYFNIRDKQLQNPPLNDQMEKIYKKNEEDIDKAYEKISKIYDEIRTLSCDLEEKYKQLSFPFNIKISKEKIADSASRLIGIANNLWSTTDGAGLENNDDIDKIRENLDIPRLK